MFGLVFEAPRVTFYLWSPWRSSALEHRLFEEIRGLPQTRFEPQFEELRVHLPDPKIFKQALAITERILKGWQEEASDGDGTERRTWRWLLEADTDGDGYDHNGEKTSIWGFLRLGLERSGADDEEKSEEIDMNGFGVRFWNSEENK
jgi:hypothetical protein